MSRRLVVARHGETVDNAAGIWQGQRDTELSERGLQQAYAAAPALAAYAPDVVVSSPLRRASVTAQRVADLLGCPVGVDERLAEINVGRWAGLTRAAARDLDPDLMAALERGEDIRRGGTGETLVELGERAGEALRSIAQGLPEDGTALVVCHGVSGRSGIAELVGLEQAYAMTLLATLGNCHWAVVGEKRSGGWRIESWNECANPVAQGARPTM